MTEIMSILGGVLVVYWSVASILAFLQCRKMFRKYSKYSPIDNPDPKWEGFIRDDYNKWDRKKIYTGCFTKMPLVLLVFSFFIFGCLFILFVQSKVGLNAWMRKIVNGYLHFCRLVFELIGVSIHKNYDENLITTPIVICNHTNFFDIFMLLLGVGPLSFMAKREIQKYPLFGSCADGLFCMYVDRDNSESRAQLLQQIKQRSENFSVQKPSIYPLVIFPQGTTSNGKVLLPFKVGAFDSLTPITGIYIKYQYGGGCGLGMDQISQAEFCFLFATNRVKAIIDKITIYPNEKENGEEYMKRCREVFSQKFELKQALGGYRDKVCLQEYRKSEMKKIK